MFWFLLGLAALILATMVIRGMSTPVDHSVDLDFNEFDMEQFRAVDKASQETWDNDMALERRKFAMLLGLAVLAMILVMAFILSGG